MKIITFFYAAVSNLGQNSFPTFSGEIFGYTWEQIQPFKVKPNV